MQVFVYATLLNHPTLSHALRYLPRTRKTKLANMVEEKYQGYPTLVSAPGKVVSGEVFEVSEAELLRLDKWEEKYRRLPFKLQDGSTAFVYLLKKEVGLSDKT